MNQAVASLYFCLSRMRQSSGGTVSWSNTSRVRRSSWEARLPFFGVQLNCSTFPWPAAILSPASKFRLKVFDKTTLVTPILSKPLWRRGPAGDRLENWTSPWLFVGVFPCHWSDSLVTGSLESFCSAIISAQIVVGRESFIASHCWYKQLPWAVI